MVKRLKIPEGEMQKVVDLRKRGLDQAGIAERLYISKSIVNNYLTAHNQGFLSIQDYQNALHQRRGFRSTSDYAHYRGLLGNPDSSTKGHCISKQSEFEKSMSRLKKRDFEGLIDESTLAHENEVEKVEIVNRALEILKGRNQRYYETIKRNVMNEETLEVIAKSYGVSGEAVRIMKVKGLKSLGYIIKDMLLQVVP